MGIEDVTGSSQGRMKAKGKRIATFTGTDVCGLLKASFLSACCFYSVSTTEVLPSGTQEDVEGEMEFKQSISFMVSLPRIPPDDVLIFTSKTAAYMWNSLSR